MKRLFALFIALCLQAPAFAQTDASHYLLTDAVLQKLKIVQDEIERRGIDTSKDLSGNDSVETMARKIDANSAVKDLLSQQGLTPMDCALTVNATLHAGLYLMAEQNGETAKAQSMLASATPEQRANIALLRKSSKPAQ